MSSLAFLFASHVSHSEHWRSLQPGTTNQHTLKKACSLYLKDWENGSLIEQKPFYNIRPPPAEHQWKNFPALPHCINEVAEGNGLPSPHGSNNALLISALIHPLRWCQQGGAGSWTSILTQGQWSGKRWHGVSRARRKLKFNTIWQQQGGTRWYKAVLVRAPLPCTPTLVSAEHSKELKYHPHQAPIRRYTLSLHFHWGDIHGAQQDIELPSPPMPAC